ncbi:MAG TPA: MarR family transcriptional regulator [Pseudolabrys sp.]|nr:MarR family transcriptional regulator [Pseudolabrys sp.]
MPAASATPAATLAELIDRLGRLVRAESHAGGLNPAQWEALRYLTRCNRFSNTPGAVAQYLNATKGTVSQTLNALERKNLLVRKPDPASKRVVRLALTAEGQALARHDPAAELKRAAAALPAPQQDATAGGLAAILGHLQQSRGGRPFGVCRTCRHFRGTAPDGAPHWCALLHEPLDEPDSLAICVEHQPAA